MSQEALEEASGVSQAVISDIERKGPSASVSQAIALAKALGVTVEELFGGETARTAARPRRRRLGGLHAVPEAEVTAA